MDTKKYEALIAAVDEGSFSGAAERLGYTQSGITQMMNGLERELGFTLLVRGNKGVSLTENGRQLLPLIREMLNLDEKMMEECALIKGLERGRVRLGSFTSITLHWLPGIIEGFQKQHPGILIENIEEGEVHELERWVAEGRIDISFHSLRPNKEFTQIELMKDPMLALLPLGHPKACLEAYPVSAFADEQFLTYKESSGYESDVDIILKRSGVKPKVRFSSNYDLALALMVEHNLGVTILSELIMKGRGERIAMLPLDPPYFRSLGICTRKEGNSPAVKKFIQYTVDYMKAAGAESISAQKPE